MNATNLQRLIGNETMASPFYDDPRRVDTLIPEGGMRPQSMMPEYTLHRRLDTLVADADKYGLYMHENNVGEATVGLARDLTLGAYNATVNETPWGWMYPIADLVITGEGRDHMGHQLRPGEWAVLGISVAGKAVDQFGNVRAATGPSDPLAHGRRKRKAMIALVRSSH